MADMVPGVVPGAVPFTEAIDFLKQKVNLPTRAWTDIKEGAHARGFVIAGAMKDQLVSDFHGALVKALADGTTKADFQKAFDSIVEKHGWDFKGGRTWRARVIYDTNMRSARAAGRWAQIERAAEREKARGRTLYLRYVAVMDNRTRPEHKAWHGVILPVDHPFWKSHTPPNGWMCRCTIEHLTERDLKRYGYTPTPDDQVPEVKMEDRVVNTPDGPEVWKTPAGIDTGFGHNVGQSWLSGAVPRELQKPLPRFGGQAPKPKALPPLPPPRTLPSVGVLPDGLDPADYASAFLNRFGATVDKGAAFRDAAGHVLGIDAELFKNRRGEWKVDSQGRHRYLSILAEALKAPDEIWVDWAEVDGKPVLRRTYLAALTLPKLGKDKGAGLFALLEWTNKGWSGVTLFQGRTSAYLAKQRLGALIYQRRGD